MIGIFLYNNSVAKARIQIRKIATLTSFARNDYFMKLDNPLSFNLVSLVADPNRESHKGLSSVSLTISS